MTAATNGAGFHVKRPVRAQTHEMISQELPSVDREIRETEEKLTKLRAYRERLVCTGAIWGSLPGTTEEPLESISPKEVPDAPT